MATLYKSSPQQTKFLDNTQFSSPIITMAPLTSTIGWPGLLFAFLCFLILCCLNTMCSKGPLWDWPIIGMLPGLFVRILQVNDAVFDVLAQSGWTFNFRGPWHCNKDFLFTSDPANIHYIMSKNFTNFSKGADFFKIFDFIGKGILTSDAEYWRSQRNVMHALVNQHQFRQFSVEATNDKVEKGIRQVLDHAANNGLVLDLQDVFQRYTYDLTFKLVTGYDPGSLSAKLPEIPYSKAMDHTMSAVLFRYFLPERWWRVMGWLNIGPEKKLREARNTIDQTTAEYIAKKRQELQEKSPNGDAVEGKGHADFLTRFIMEDDDSIRKNLHNIDDKFLRDTIVNLILAGRDTTSSALTWFFWLLSRNLPVLAKIKDEIDQSGMVKERHNSLLEWAQQEKLVYLHGALCEALRLYPPVPLEHACPLTPVMLPSGHRADPSLKIVCSYYAMGRMESLWGEDCLEFKPERWISERGGIKHEPSYKFTAFHAGPRACLGKEIAFTQMKAVAATIIHDYEFGVVEGQIVTPQVSIILRMKDGLKVRVSKRRLNNE